MPLTLLDICKSRLLALTPRRMQHFTDHWDMFTALEFHGLLSSGTPDERTAAADHTAGEVYETMRTYLDDDARQVSQEEPAVTGYYLDPAIYNKLMYMAKHGLSISTQELQKLLGTQIGG